MGGMVEEEEEARERQLAELEFVQSAYAIEEARVTENSTNGRPSVVRSLTLPVNPASNENSLHFVTIELNLEMPPAYPVRKESTLLVTGSLIHSPANPTFVRKAALNSLPHLVDECQGAAMEYAGEHDGGEAVWHVLSRADGWIDANWSDILRRHEKSISDAPDVGRAHCCKTMLGRRIIHSHHIIANSKRKAIARLASDNRLGGCVKIGWPGVIVVEGSESSCRLFVDEVTSWRWQHLSVRAEERMEIPSDDDLDSNRQLPREFIELGEDDMSKMAKYCREAGLEHMFFACLKISDKKISDNEAKGTDAMADHPNAIHARRFSHGALVQVDHMNDRGRYRKSLQNICESAGCSFFVRHCPATSASAPRPTILIGLCGDIVGVKNVLKRWRNNRVDVDARNKPCLERMMTVLMEGGVRGTIRGPSTSVHGSSAECSLDELKELIIDVFGDDWVKVIANNDINSTH